MPDGLASLPGHAVPTWLFAAVVGLIVLTVVCRAVFGERCPNCRRFRAGMWSGDEILGAHNELRRTKFQCRYCGHWWDRIDRQLPGESWSILE